MNIGEEFISWAKREASISGLVLIGSRSRCAESSVSADAGSDWDFQVITSAPEVFSTEQWCLSAGMSRPYVYVYRAGRLGHTPKVSAIFANGDIDIIIIPSFKLLLASYISRSFILNLMPNAKRALGDLSLVLQGGYLFIKTTPRWKALYGDVCCRRVSRRLSDDMILVLWRSFLCDYKSVMAKIERGEFCAAQRWIHLNLAEINFSLLHELRSRSHLISFPDARRIEAIVIDQWLDKVAVDCRLECCSLTIAAEKCLQTCKMLVLSLGISTASADNVTAIMPKRPDLSAALASDGAVRYEQYH